MTLDPNAPALHDSGIYGLDATVDDAGVVVVPVPFAATVSYRGGAALGPEAILRASRQVDLFDADVGRPYAAGIAMLPHPAAIAALHDDARSAAERCIDAITRGETPDPALVQVVDDAGLAVNRFVRDEATKILVQRKLPVVVDGDHSVPYGSIAACAAAVGDQPLGVLHLDAHCDLRDAYEGFRWSHASIMKNVVDTIPNARLVQVGIRDFSDGELDVVRKEPGRVSTYFDAQLRRPRLEGRFPQVADAIASTLPEHVYLSFDVDGLDPAFCPHTGTPVPGGLSFDEAVTLLEAVVRAGKRIVGLDLNEVSPGPELDEEDTWDAIVGARLLYKMIGFALMSQGKLAAPDLPKAPGVR
jgi:agmatinase